MKDIKEKAEIIKKMITDQEEVEKAEYADNTEEIERLASEQPLIDITKVEGFDTDMLDMAGILKYREDRRKGLTVW